MGWLGGGDTICDARSVDFDAGVLGLPAPVCEGVVLVVELCWYLGVVAMLRIKPRELTREALELTARSERMEYISVLSSLLLLLLKLWSDVEVEFDIT